MFIFLDSIKRQIDNLMRKAKNLKTYQINKNKNILPQYIRDINKNSDMNKLHPYIIFMI